MKKIKKSKEVKSPLKTKAALILQVEKLEKDLAESNKSNQDLLELKLDKQMVEDYELCHHGDVSYKVLNKLSEAQQWKIEQDQEYIRTKNTLIWNLRHAVDEAETSNVFLKAQVIDLKKMGTSKDPDFAKDMLEKIRELKQEVQTLKHALEASKANEELIHKAQVKGYYKYGNFKPGKRPKKQ